MHPNLTTSSRRAFALGANAIVALLLVAWWLLNVWQAWALDLVDDEAYYWTWINYNGAWQWGYYDHPPLVAVLITVTQWIGGSLGVRLASLTLQPLYLWLLWCLLRPKQPQRWHALLYVGVCFAMPALQIYGLLALPDAPLLMCSVLFIAAFVAWVKRDSTPRALLLGLTMALLAYSKYHGVLVVAAALIAVPKVWRRGRLFLAMAVALLLFAPHLVWQQQNGWPSFAYHLNTRHSGFNIENPLMVLLNLLIFFNPLLIVHYAKAYCTAWRSRREDTPLTNVALWLVMVVAGFFFVAAFGGSTQAQWLLPIAISLVVLLSQYEMQRPHPHRFVMLTVSVVAVLMVAARILLVVNPTHAKGQIWDNYQSYNQIADMAQGKPVLFSNYAQAGKYAFYTHQPCSCTPLYFGRYSQWTMRDDDQQFLGKTVIREANELPKVQHLSLANGTIFEYRELQHFRPIRDVSIECIEEPVLYAGGDSLSALLSIHNPYHYALQSDASDSLRVLAYLYIVQRRQPRFISPDHIEIEPYGTTTVRCHFAMPTKYRLEEGRDYPLAFTLTRNVGQPSIAHHFYHIRYTTSTQH